MQFRIDANPNHICKYLEHKNNTTPHPNVGWQQHNTVPTTLYNAMPQYQLVTANTTTPSTPDQPAHSFIHTAVFFDTHLHTYSVGHTSNRNTWNPQPIPWDEDATTLITNLSSLNSVLHSLHQVHHFLDISGIHPAPAILIDNIAHLLQHRDTYNPFPKEPFMPIAEPTHEEKEHYLGWSFSTLNQGSLRHCNPSWEIVTGLWDKEEPSSPVVGVFYDVNTGSFHVASCDMSDTWASGMGMWQPSNTVYAGSSENPYEIIGLVKNVLEHTDKYANFYASDAIALVTCLLAEAV